MAKATATFKTTTTTTTMRASFILSILLLTTSRFLASAAVPMARAVSMKHRQANGVQRMTPTNLLVDIRGGDDKIPDAEMVAGLESTSAASSALSASLMPTAVEAISSALRSGPYGVPALFGIATAVVLPLTMYCQSFSVTVGYGLSIMAMGIWMRVAFGDQTSLTIAMAVYGFRLAAFLYVRSITIPSRSYTNRPSKPYLKRLPTILSVSLFYAFMVTPVLYALRASAGVADSTTAVVISPLRKIGTIVAWTGVILEGVADGQKYLAYLPTKNNTSTDKKPKFVGPTGLAYRICRHPNYLGEIMFYIGLLLAGVDALGTSITGWVCSSLGLFGIFALMSSSTKRLTKKQAEKYGGQEKYDQWVKAVPYPLIPFVRG